MSMSQPERSIAAVYNPLNLDKRSLLESFVVRQREFDKVFCGLKNSLLDHISQNYLLQGQRGSGKTTLLAKLRYALEDSPSLSHLLPIQFMEEQYHIFSLDRLWQTIAEELEEKPGFENLSEELDSYGADGDLFPPLRKRLRKQRKKLLLLIDNFGDILDRLKEKEHKKLRDILHETDLQIVAASTKTLEATYRHDKPFFENFQTVYLGGLTARDVQLLLQHLSGRHGKQKALDIVANQKGRIETIRRLTGGVPRTVVLLYEVFMDDSASVFEDLEGILDRVTPLYKHKMDDLPTQQQAIVDAIAMNWDGMPTAEISNRTGIKTKAVAAQLKGLEKSGLVLSRLVDGKNKMYQLEERFFNIWYLMRCGSKKKKRQVWWLVRFLQEWCTAEQLQTRARSHIKMAKAGRLRPRGGYYMAEALSQALPDPILRYEVRSTTKEFLSQDYPEIAEQMAVYSGRTTNIAKQAIKAGEPEKALEEIFKAAGFENSEIMFLIGRMYHYQSIDKLQPLILKAVGQNHGEIADSIVQLFQKVGRDLQKAELYYLKAAEQNQTDAMNNLALLYETELRDFQKAELYYLKAAELNDVNAMYNLALLYETEFRDIKKAESFYLKAAELNHASAMYNLALLYQTELKDFRKAELYYLKAAEQNDAKAMVNLALLYQTEFKDYPKAEQYYLKAAELNHADAMFNLALLYKTEFKDFQKAELYYLKAAEQNHVGAMNNLALLYETEFKDLQKAEQYYLKAAKQNHAKAMYNLALLYENEFRDFQKAESFYLKAAEQNLPQAMVNLAVLYEREFHDFQKAERFFKKALETDFNGRMRVFRSIGKSKIGSKTIDAVWNMLEKYRGKEDHVGLYARSFLLCGMGEYRKSAEQFELFLSLIEPNDIDSFQQQITEYFLLLLSRKQLHLARNLFEKAKLPLKELIRPVYFALMTLMKEEFPKEYARLGSELKETVDEVLDRIKALASDR